MITLSNCHVLLCYSGLVGWQIALFGIQCKAEIILVETSSVFQERTIQSPKPGSSTLGVIRSNNVLTQDVKRLMSESIEHGNFNMFNLK